MMVKRLRRVSCLPGQWKVLKSVLKMFALKEVSSDSKIVFRCWVRKREERPGDRSKQAVGQGVLSAHHSPRGVGTVKAVMKSCVSFFRQCECAAPETGDPGCWAPSFLYDSIRVSPWPLERGLEVASSLGPSVATKRNEVSLRVTFFLLPAWTSCATGRTRPGEAAPGGH